jgi:hypothetical protein
MSSTVASAMDRVGLGQTKYWDNAPKLEDLRNMLESSSEKENSEGIKYILAVRQHGTHSYA